MSLLSSLPSYNSIASNTESDSVAKVLDACIAISKHICQMHKLVQELVAETLACQACQLYMTPRVS